METQEETCNAYSNKEPLITDYCNVILYHVQMKLYEMLDDLEGLLYELDHVLEDLVGHDMLDCTEKHKYETHNKVKM